MNRKDNFSNLLDSLADFKLEFDVKVTQKENCSEVILQEIADLSKEEGLKRVVVQVFDEPPSYSVCLYKKSGESSNDPQYKFVYEIKVTGENDFSHIKQNVEDLISGKKGKPHPVRYPL